MRISNETSSAAAGAAGESTTAAHSAPSAASLAKLIEVREPYLALQDLASSQPGYVTARVWPEQPVDLEISEISAAEAGRHLAILGSIASAMLRPDPSKRVYYLAERAVMTASDAPAHRTDAPLRLEARCTESSARRATADCQIYGTDGRPRFHLDVAYTLVPEKVFQRLFAAHRFDMRRNGLRSAQTLSEEAIREQRRNPYCRRLDLETIELTETRVRARLSMVPAEACAGHFPQYPALPVAVLMEALCNAGGQLLRKHFASPALRYRVLHGDTIASKLVFAGQSIVVEGELLERLSDWTRKIAVRARLPTGEEVGSATLSLEAVPGAER